MDARFASGPHAPARLSGGSVRRGEQHPATKHL